MAFRWALSSERAPSHRKNKRGEKVTCASARTSSAGTEFDSGRKMIYSMLNFHKSFSINDTRQCVCVCRALLGPRYGAGAAADAGVGAVGATTTRESISCVHSTTSELRSLNEWMICYTFVTRAAVTTQRRGMRQNHPASASREYTKRQYIRTHLGKNAREKKAEEKHTHTKVKWLIECRWTDSNSFSWNRISCTPIRCAPNSTITRHRRQCRQ